MTSETRSCIWCGTRTTSPVRTCRLCSAVERRARKPSPKSCALTGGRWVPNGRGVLVWQWFSAPAREQVKCA